ncbi:hypothetical protein [Paenibacillus ferrarius]|uniref:hypothetical protein n=1 Tax=Paenibacillus ferrarius TaxID=1469647 RepID=UPI003D2C3AFB
MKERKPYIPLFQFFESFRQSINIASRLQKIAPNFTFAFSARGFDQDFFSENVFDEYQMIKIKVRGIKGNEELMYVLKSEINSLSPEMQAQIQIL